jgi:hypothetical protein
MALWFHTTIHQEWLLVARAPQAGSANLHYDVFITTLTLSWYGTMSMLTSTERGREGSSWWRWCRRRLPAAVRCATRIGRPEQWINQSKRHERRHWKGTD